MSVENHSPTPLKKMVVLMAAGKKTIPEETFEEVAAAEPEPDYFDEPRSTEHRREPGVASRIAIPNGQAPPAPPLPANLFVRTALSNKVPRSSNKAEQPAEINFQINSVPAPISSNCSHPDLDNRLDSK